jgi:1,2-phenylacetyl-CoA epoxidase catalytic subunit
MLRNEDESIEKQALDWNLQGTRRRERLKETWKRTILEEAVKCGKTWSDVASWWETETD